MSELTITALRFGFLLLLWVLIFSIVSTMRRDLMVGRRPPPAPQQPGRSAKIPNWPMRCHSQ